MIEMDTHAPAQPFLQNIQLRALQLHHVIAHSKTENSCMNKGRFILFNENDKMSFPLRSTGADVRIIQIGVERHVTSPVGPANARLSTAHKIYHQLWPSYSRGRCRNKRSIYTTAHQGTWDLTGARSISRLIPRPLSRRILTSACMDIDGCSQIRGRAAKEETIRRPPLPSTSPMLGGKMRSLILAPIYVSK